MSQAALDSESVSLVIPFYNEAANVESLMRKIHQALVAFELAWEVIAVDDGSHDGTFTEIQKAQQYYGHHVHAVQLQRNYGQTAAMQAGIDAARGTLIVTLDGDLQNDPRDIPRLVTELLERDLDLLTGWRKNRQDTLIMRKIPSRIANKLIRKVTGINIHDYGCSLKVYRASVIKRVRLYGEMHRFIPAWVSVSVSPQRIGESVVNHHARQAGESKYGIFRTFRVLIDLLFMWFFLRFRARPGHFFGSIGLLFGFLGSAILFWLGVEKFGFNQSIGGRPLLLIGVVLVVAAIQFLTTGVLAELVVRTYFESSGRNAYLVREDKESSESRTWYQQGSTLNQT